MDLTIELIDVSCLSVYEQMKEMFPHPCPSKDKFQWIMGVRPVVQAAPAVIQALRQVVL